MSAPVEMISPISKEAAGGRKDSSPLSQIVYSQGGNFLVLAALPSTAAAAAADLHVSNPRRRSADRNQIGLFSPFAFAAP